MRPRGKQTIQSVAGPDTRPTTSRVREAVFNIWQFEIADCRWLDLCAGTGAMGAEALRRGASIVVGIEQAGRACAAIQQNWRKLARPEQQVQILQVDVLRGLGQLVGRQFDRIYFDPPYGCDFYEAAIAAIATYDLLSPAGVLAVEHRKSRGLPSLSGTLIATQTRNYGTTALTFYQTAARLTTKG
ncbi:16S rRNA (guanine(966)-N(2))-methyltransferase RsmD [Altericista sp. CCNU0014]|uniref:16S rRNA (guanine(966)-N(2))-methyltransferase RsmD n=1 Tax=Altericista sp. CCNU0014 TaxID=3082949 RepID=UPI00384A8E7E